MEQYIISITAQDRPGIVAGVSEALLQLGGNIAAASQTVHQGYFAMMLKIDFTPALRWPPADPERSETTAASALPDGPPADPDKPTLIAGHIRACAGSGLHVFVTPFLQSPRPAAADPQVFIVTALGPDRRGILHHLTRYLAGKDVNIDDLYCFVDPQNNFVVICQVTVPPDLDVFMLQADLESVGQAMGITVQMQHENIFVATNDLLLPALARLR